MNRNMSRYICKRLLLMMPVLLGVSFVIFTLLYVVPGDPAVMALGNEVTEEAYFEWREQYGLNDPFLIQYAKYIWGIVTRGDFGNSYKTGKPVVSMIMERFPTTFLLALLTTIVAISIGVTFGIISATHQGRIIDGIVRVIGMAGVSVPVFWLGLLLIIEFAVNLKWFPVSGWKGPMYWVLPAITLGVGNAARLMRVTRSSMLENIRQDYVRTARAKGQTEGVVTRHHILGNAMIPIVTSAGQYFGISLGGAVIVEQIFSIPGLGRLMIDALNNRDYPQVKACVLTLAVTFGLINLLVDILYAYIDPRIKAQYQKQAVKKRGGHS